MYVGTLLLAAASFAVTPSATRSTGDTGGIFTGGSGATGATGETGGTGDTGFPSDSGDSGGSGGTVPTPVDTGEPHTDDQEPPPDKKCGCSSTGSGLGLLVFPALLAIRRRR